MTAPWVRMLMVAVLLALPWGLRASAFGEGLARAESLRTADPAAFKRVLRELDRQHAEATPSERRQLRLLHDHRHVLEGEYEAAVGDAVALFDQAPEADVKYRAALLVSTTAALTRDFTLGLRYMEHVLRLQESIEDRALKLRGLGAAAMLYNQYGQYALGLQFADQLLAAGPEGRTRCYARQVRIEALNGLGRPIDEDTDIHAAISDCAAQKETVGANLIRANLAERWARAGKVKQALALLDASLPEAQATGYAWLISRIRSLQAVYRLETGDTGMARQHANAVLGLERQDPHDLPTVTAHRVLYEVAQRNGDIATALTQYRLYAEADKARLDDIKAREFAFQLSRHELNQKNQSIALLKSENRLLQLRQEVARRSAWNFRLALALLLVLAASLGYWGWRARRTHGSLRTLAETDGLTGLANRRHFRGRSESALAMCAQRRRPACVLLLDLDHFKQINDQCGHSTGDWVLREVARVGKLHCRENDLFGRIGGEEFAMTLVDCDADAAMRIAEACRRSVESIDPGAINCALPVAVSIGVVATEVSGYDYEVLIANADAAMYRSKVAGRNRVTLYEAPPVPAPGQPVLLERRNAEAMLKQY